MQLRDYQMKQLAYHLSADRTLNTSEPGTGKTPTVCVYMGIRYEADKCKTAFVMPTSLFYKNKEEVMKWCYWDESQVKVLSGTQTQREKIYNDENVRCFIMSFDCFAREWKKLPSDVNCVVVDEIHLGFSTHTSKRTQQFYQSSRRFKYYILMTGTLIDGRYSSAYPSIAVIEPRFYLNYNNFMNYHGVFNKFGQVVSWKNPDKIRKILGRISCGITVKEAYKDRKENIIIFEPCEMDSTQKEAYKDMEKDALVELEDDFIDATQSGGVKQIRCRQIITCPESLGIQVKFHGIDESLKVHLNDLIGKQVVIFSTFKAEQERIVKVCEDMGFKTGLINGSVSANKRGEIDKEFREGRLDIIVGSPQTCSIGFNWENASNIIFTSLDYKDSTFEQAIARGNRGSRETPLVVYILTYNTKVEHRIYDIIKRKRIESKKVKETY